MGGGGLDFAQAVLDPGLLVDVAQADGGQPHDGVDRRADIVGHIGEEPALGLIGLLRCAQGALQRSGLLLQLPAGGAQFVFFHLPIPSCLFKVIDCHSALQYITRRQKKPLENGQHQSENCRSTITQDRT